MALTSAVSAAGKLTVLRSPALRDAFRGIVRCRARGPVSPEFTGRRPWGIGVNIEWIASGSVADGRYISKIQR